MKDPYKKEKGPGRVGGDPLKNVVGAAAGVPGQTVQPNKTAMSTQAAKGVTMGKSNSFKTSSGLINALDVVNGVNNVLSGVNKYMDVSDQVNQGKMEKDIAELTASEAWTDNESPDYIGDENKNQALNGVYDKYKGVWNRNKSEAWFKNKRTGTNIQYQNAGFEKEMTDISLEAASLEQSGDIEAAAQLRATGYGMLQQKYAGDDARMAQIETADLSAGASWATAVNASVDQLMVNWEQSGGMQNFVMAMSPDLTYEEWRQAAIADAASKDPGMLGETLYDSYSEQDGEFTGLYAEQTATQVDAKLKPMYAAAVAAKVAQQQETTEAGIASIPKQISTRVLADQSGSDGGKAVVFADGVARMISMTEGLPRKMSPGQKRVRYLSAMEQSIASIYRQDPTLSDDTAAAMIDGSMHSNGKNILAGIRPDLAYGSEEGDAILAEMSDAAKASLREARAANGGAQKKDAATEIADSVTTTNDQETLKKIIDRNPLVKLSTGESTSEPIHFLDEKGQPFTDDRSLAYMRRAQKTIVAGGLMRGDAPEQILASQKEFAAKYDAWRANVEAGGTDMSTALLHGALSEALKGTPYTGVSGGATGTYTLGWDPSVGGNVEAQGLAQIAAVLPHLRLDQKTGFYDPLNKVNQDEINTIATNMTRAVFRGDGKIDRAEMATIPKVINRFRTVYEPAVANRAVAAALAGQVAAEMGHSLPADVLRNATNLIERQLGQIGEAGDDIAMENVYATLDNMLKRRGGLIEIKNTQTFVADIGVSDDAKGIIAGTLGLETGVNDQGQPYARPKSVDQDTWGFGWTFFNDTPGVDDAMVQPFWDNLSTGDLQTVIGVGADAGIWDTSDGTIKLSKAATDDPIAAQRELSIAMRRAGLEIEVEKSEESGWFEFDDGVIGTNDRLNSVSVKNTQQSWKMLPDGSFVPDNTTIDGMGGASFQDDMARGIAFREQSWNEWFQEGFMGVGSKMSATGNPKMSHDMSRVDIFEHNIYAQGISTGRSADNVRKWMNKPVNRQMLADHARPARNIMMSESAGVERGVLANQMEATMEALQAADVGMDAQDVADATAILTSLRAGTLSPDGPLWQATQKVAKAQGFDPNNPPMWATKVAIMAMLMPDEEDAITTMSYFDLKADRGYMPAASRDAAMPHNRRGYTQEVRYNFDNMPEGSRLTTGRMDLPIFGAATVKGTPLGDPKTLMRRQTSVKFEEARARKNAVKLAERRARPSNAMPTEYQQMMGATVDPNADLEVEAQLSSKRKPRP